MIDWSEQGLTPFSGLLHADIIQAKPGTFVLTVVAMLYYLLVLFGGQDYNVSTAKVNAGFPQMTDDGHFTLCWQYLGKLVASFSRGT